MMRLITTKPDGLYETYSWEGANFIQAPFTIAGSKTTLASLGLAMSALLI